MRKAPAPLSEKAWKRLEEILDTPQTKEQQEMLRKAIENGKKMKVHL